MVVALCRQCGGRARACEDFSRLAQLPGEVEVPLRVDGHLAGAEFVIR
jgi:hypothetical protein